MTDRRFKAPGQTALYQCLLTVICVYSLSMNEPKNEKEKKAHALILLPAPAHSSGNQVIVMSQRTLISFPWFGSVVTSNTRNQVFILASDTRSQLHCFDGLKT